MGYVLTTVERRGREWLWPAYDVGLLKTFNSVDYIDRIMAHIKHRGVCIQAGGACGVWPARLCELFEVVYSFEPDALNFECLERNAPDAITINAALGAKSGKVSSVQRHPTLQSNAGAGYVKAGDEIACIALDDAIQCDVDLIALDVEGAEHDALIGARRIIERSRPVVVVEEKSLPQGNSPLAARRLLESWGYSVREIMHNDAVFTC